MTLRGELETYASGGREAAGIADLAAVVVALLRDRRFACIPLRKFDLVFAEVRIEIEQRLFDELRSTVHLDDVDTITGE